MTGGNPGLGIHQNGGVEPDVVRVLLNKFFPPGLFYIVLQLNAQRTVIPGVGKAAINLAARENKAPALAQGHKFLHGFLGVLHVFFSFSRFGSGRICYKYPRFHLNSDLADPHSCPITAGTGGTFPHRGSRAPSPLSPQGLTPSRPLSAPGMEGYFSLSSLLTGGTVPRFSRNVKRRVQRETEGPPSGGPSFIHFLSRS